MYSGVLSDAIQHDLKKPVRSFYLPNVIIPENRTAICGPAFTCAGKDLPKDITEEEFAAIDRVRVDMMEEFEEGWIQVIGCDSNKQVAHYGDIGTLVTKMRGGEGLILDGFLRDIPLIEKMNIGVAYLGTHVQDSMHQWGIYGYKKKVDICGQVIKHGDIIHYTKDGGIVIDKEDLEKVAKFATDRKWKESEVRRRVGYGHKLSDILEEEGRW